MTATLEQVEAVARAINPDFDDMDSINRNAILGAATDAIAAYEATRPVVSDEELITIYEEIAHPGLVLASIQEEQKRKIAGIRAVRMRLEGLTTT